MLAVADVDAEFDVAADGLGPRLFELDPADVDPAVPWPPEHAASSTPIPAMPPTRSTCRLLSSPAKILETDISADFTIDILCYRATRPGNDTSTPKLHPGKDLGRDGFGERRQQRQPTVAQVSARRNHKAIAESLITWPAF
ncbi:MAG: hypothetical protein ABJD68_05215 [Nakamurella sp.]